MSTDRIRESEPGRGLVGLGRVRAEFDRSDVESASTGRILAVQISMISDGT